MESIVAAIGTGQRQGSSPQAWPSTPKPMRPGASQRAASFDEALAKAIARAQQ
jgi:hypothetical protein